MMSDESGQTPEQPPPGGDGSPDNGHSPDSGLDTRQAVRELLVLAALWLPLGFFLWFYLAPLLVKPVGAIADLVLTAVLPEAIDGLTQLRHTFDVQTLIPAERLVDGRVALLSRNVNPLIYGYGVPLLIGLVMATPGLKPRERAQQIVFGYVILVLVQVWGVVWETLKAMRMEMGPLSAHTIAALGLPDDLIALCYQLGFLILPAVTPIVLWILFNRRFLMRYF